MTTKTASPQIAMRRAALLRSVATRLDEKKITYHCIRSRLHAAVVEKRIAPSEQLKCAERQVDSHFAAAQAALARLGTANSDDWADLERNLERAMDDLSESIKKVVARFS